MKEHELSIRGCDEAQEQGSRTRSPRVITKLETDWLMLVWTMLSGTGAAGILQEGKYPECRYSLK